MKKSVKFWTFFWSWGIFLLMPIEIIILAFIPGVSLLLICVICSLNPIALGLDYIISSILKLTHIYYVSHKGKAIIYYLDERQWEHNFNKKKMIGLGVFWIALGFIYAGVIVSAYYIIH